MLVSLPMYDLPEHRAATDAWWRAIRDALAAAAMADLPLRLERKRPPEDLWQDPRLLLSQCCGADLVLGVGRVAVALAAPCWAIDGLRPGRYRSLIVVRASDPREDLAAFADARLAANSRRSWSGWFALARELARRDLELPFFGEVALTGSHRAALAAVASGRSDAAAVDEVTWWLLADARWPELAGLRVLAITGDAPALPYITARRRGRRERSAIRGALRAAATAPAAARLRITDVVATDPTAYDEIAHAAAPVELGRRLAPERGGARSHTQVAGQEDAPRCLPVDRSPR